MDNLAISKTPYLSIIIPAYQSQTTLAECLRGLTAQTYRDSEIIVIDSDPSPTAHAFVTEQFPGVRYFYSPVRLLPHAARNLGVEKSRGDWLLFMDPDIYAPPDWVAEMVATFEAQGGVVVSALLCYGNKWLDWGAHFCKFDTWLPGGPLRQIEIGPTAGLLCERTNFEKVGGFESNHMLADTLLSWAFEKAKVPLWFQPKAIAYHHHTSSWGAILRERYVRGHEYGHLRVSHEGWGRWQLVRHSLLSLIIPLRLVGLSWRMFKNAAWAGLAGSFMWHSPVAVSGQAAWLAGETVAYFNILSSQGQP